MPDERRELPGQVARTHDDRRQAREVGGELRVRDLEDGLGPIEVAQAVRPSSMSCTVGAEESRTRSAVACEHSTCPPCARPISRAARFSTGP